jgi:diacylglycerol kinase (ATP)
VIGVREGCRYVSRDYELELDGDARAVRALLIAFANGGEYGNGIKLCASAELDDGLLDATVVEERSVLARFWHARHLAKGTPHRAPRVTSRQIRRAVVRTNGPIEYHVDGEPGIADDAIEIGIRPRALWIRI